MTNLRIPALSVPALSLALLAALATSACGSSDAGTDLRADGSSAVPGAPAAASTADTDAAPDTEVADVPAPDACTLLTVDDIKAATGASYSAGTGTDYDNTCRYDTSSERVTVSISEVNGLEMAEPSGIEFVPVDGLPGATRVDAVVYVELDASGSPSAPTCLGSRPPSVRPQRPRRSRRSRFHGSDRRGRPREAGRVGVARAVQGNARAAPTFVVR